MNIDAMTVAQFSMHQDELRLQSISQNISNMQTPGYKRQILEATVFDANLSLDYPAITQSMQTARVLQQGTLQQSQNIHDLALSGKGFFVVRTEEGIFYTRHGELQVNEQGELISSTGELILGKNGPIQVDDNEFSIDTQGQIYVNGQKFDQLALVEFSKQQKLHYRGQGLYESAEAPTPSDGDLRVLAGFIEHSNVQSTDEMLMMLKTSRHFEALQRVMRTADDLLSQAIKQLGERNV